MRGSPWRVKMCGADFFAGWTVDLVGLGVAYGGGVGGAAGQAHS